jgi:type I restriction enzyme, S subunit
MRLRPYPKYKPSGIDWVGNLPEYWTTPPLYIRYQVDLGKMLDESRITGEYLLTYLRNIDVQWDIINVADLPEMDISPAELDRYTVKEGDLLVCEGGEVGRAAIVPAQATGLGFQKALHRVRPRRSTEIPRFLYYTLLSASGSGVFIADGNPNTIPHLTGEKLRRYRFPCPPLAEQSRIADFLDLATAKADTLIQKKRALIENLREKRAAVISQTVTCGLPPEAAKAAGLNPHPRAKPSGIDWIGDIPEHWDAVPLFRITKEIQTGPFGSQLHQHDYVDGGIPLVNPIHIQEDGLTPDEEDTVTPDTAARLDRYSLRRGDIVFARRGDIGRCALIDDRAIGWLCGTGSMVVRLSGCDARYFTRVFRSPGFVAKLTLNAVGTTMPNLNPSIVGRMMVPVPPSTEQGSIATFLDVETTKIDRMIEKVEEAIARLQEYRTALIGAAVTGKIDLSEAISTSQSAVLVAAG